jgi:hypothetical protein
MTGRHRVATHKKVQERLPAGYSENESLALKYAGNGDFPIASRLVFDLLCDEIPRWEDWSQLVFDRDILLRLREAQQDDTPLYYGTLARLKKAGVPTYEVEQAVKAFQVPTRSRPQPQDSTTLMAKTFEPPVMYIARVLPHGMTILAGKRKKGKSTLALDLALSMAVGRKALRQLATVESRVLYISLEDQEPLIHQRLRQMQANFTGHPHLTFLYEFPRLDEPEAMAWLREYADEGYGVIFLDVLGRVLPAGKRFRQSFDEYREMTDLLGPLQRLANERRIALVILDHVRKAEADDPFDAVQGSGAKTGVADHLMVFERRFREKDATIQMSSRILGDEVMKITMVEGHLELVGIGEEFELNQEEHRVTKVIREERRPMAVKEIMQAIGVPLSQYPRFRVAIFRMYHKGVLGKTKYGKFTAGTIDDDEEEKDIPI